MEIITNIKGVELKNNQKFNEFHRGNSIQLTVDDIQVLVSGKSIG